MTCLLCNTPAAPKGLQLLIVGDGGGGAGLLGGQGSWDGAADPHDRNPESLLCCVIWTNLFHNSEHTCPFLKYGA